MDPQELFKEQSNNYTLDDLDDASFEKWNEWYLESIKRKELKLIYLTAFLCMSSISQFVIIDYSFLINFGVDKPSSDYLFIQLAVLFIGLLVTAALPITTFIDEFKLLEHRLEVNIGDAKFSPIIWIILPADFLLTLQAICSIGWKYTENSGMVTLLGFLVAAIFATASLYSSRGIAASFRQLNKAKENLQILHAHRVNPVDLYEDREKIRLRKSLDQAKLDLDQAKQEVENIKVENEGRISTLNLKNSEELRKKEEDIEKLKGEIEKFKEDIENVNKLRTKFNKIRAPIVDLIGQGKNIFGKFSELDESIQDFSFPRIEVQTLASKNGNSVPQSIYYMKWQNSNYSWEDLQLPSEPSTVGRRLLGLLVQQGNLPRPDVRDFAPRSGLANCMVLRFEDYGVVVYCRDDDYRQGEVWTFEDQAAFEEKVVYEQKIGMRVLRFSSQEIMGDPSRVLEKINNALVSRIEVEDEE